MAHLPHHQKRLLRVLGLEKLHWSHSSGHYFHNRGDKTLRVIFLDEVASMQGRMGLIGRAGYAADKEALSATRYRISVAKAA
jgi:hypothetical protein